MQNKRVEKTITIYTFVCSCRYDIENKKSVQESLQQIALPIAKI